MTDSPAATEQDHDVWAGAVMIPIDKLVFRPDNVNEMSQIEFDELVAEIDENGFDEPPQVIPITDGDDAGLYIVLGGEHRVRAAHALVNDGRSEFAVIPCVIKEHLIGASEEEIAIWCVKRNNIRGRINAQKYADLERRLSDRHKIRTKVARERMLIRGDRLKRLRKNAAVLNNEEDGGTPSSGGKAQDNGNGKTKAGAGAGAGGEQPGSSGVSADAQSRSGPATDGERSRNSELRSRRSLLAALKTAEQDVLLQSADSVEFGYLFFAQGAQNQTHLVVDESDRLHMLVKRMVSACKDQSAKIDEFLVTAITNELKNWEDR